MVMPASRSYRLRPRLQRGTAVAEQIPDEAEARRQRVPVDDVFLCGKFAGRHPAAGGGALRGNRHHEALVAKARVDGEASEGPGVLDVQAGVGPRLLVAARVVDQPHRLRHAVGDDLNDVFARFEQLLRPAGADLRAHLDVVRAGHIRDEAGVGEHPRRVRVLARRDAGDDRADLIEGGDGVRVGLLLEAELVVDRQREHRELGEQLVRHRRAPLELPDVVQPGGLLDRRHRLVDAGVDPVVRPVAAPLRAAIVERGELVPCGRLPGQPERAVRDALIVHGLRAARVERVAQVVVRGPAAIGAEEPQPVAENRPAVGQVDVVHALDPVPGDEAERHQLVVRVVALEARVAAGGEDGAAELVAAVARNHVDLHAADRRFRRQRAGLVARSLPSGRR